MKLENVLFDSNKNIKLIDFGFSTVCQPGKRLKIFCGTPSYMAPEIVRRMEYEGKPVDIWSLGILLYALLCGCFPFRAKSYPDLYRRIARGTFIIPEEFSPSLKDFLRQLLAVDPSSRITAFTSIRHPWLQSQFIVAPDLGKIKLETAILISDKPDDDLDDVTLDEICRFGITKDEIIRQILTKTHSALSTFYYLLLDNIIELRKKNSRRNYDNMQRTQIKVNSSLSNPNINIMLPSNNNVQTKVNNEPKYMQSTLSKQNRNILNLPTYNFVDNNIKSRPKSAHS